MALREITTGVWIASDPIRIVGTKLLRFDRAHDRETDASFAGVLDEQRFPGFRLHETVLVDRASRSLVVADLAHNVGRPEDAWTKFYTRVMGFYDSR